MGVDDHGQATVLANTMDNPNAGAFGRLSPADQQLVRGMAALLIDVIPSFSVAAAEHLQQQLPELPTDAETVASTRATAAGNPREVLSMLRSGLPLTAHETPAEALAHARYLQARGIGLSTVIGVYKYGYAMFRQVVGTELAARAEDPDQMARIGQAADEYMFAYVGQATTRLAAEYGVVDGGWYPSADDEVLTNPASIAAAGRLREEQIARGTWLAATPEQSHARQETERMLEDFALTIESGVREHGLSDRLKLADTTINITLADEPDLSVTILLDRSPIEVVDGVVDAEARMWIASVDLTRIWSPDFYLAMAITKGRLRVEGPVRKFLRIVPVLRVLSETYHQISESPRSGEVS
jgi:hypothetical protein